MRGRRSLGGRLLPRPLLAGLTVLCWLSGLTLPIVLCDTGEGHMAYELAFQVCCPSEADPGPSAAPTLAAREDCGGCTDRALSFLGTLSRLPATPRPALAVPAVVPSSPPALAASEPRGPCALRVDFDSPPGAPARIQLPLLC